MKLLFIVTIISFFTAFLYSRIWIFISNYLNKDIIPTGFGFFIIFSLFPFLNYQVNSVSYISLYFLLGLSIISIIYWIDDLLGLPALIRFLLQFFLGVFISCYTLSYSYDLNSTYLIIAIIFIGLLFIFFINVINFYDGLDLNISMLIFISLLLAYYYNEDVVILDKLIIYCIGITIGFSILNLFPKTLYFGDSGCFIFTGILMYIIINNLLMENYLILIVFTSLMLPSIDLIYVNILRIYLKEDLFSRNYYYLYQITQKKFKNYVYLILQPFNLFLIFSIGFIFEKLGISYYNSIILASLLSSISFYFFCRFFLIK